MTVHKKFIQTCLFLSVEINPNLSDLSVQITGKINHEKTKKAVQKPSEVTYTT